MTRRPIFQEIADAFGRLVASPQADLVALMLVVYAGVFLLVSAYQVVASAGAIA